jgi:DNA-binding transcriptional ArsR family regulator
MSRSNRKFDLEKFFVALSDRNRLRLINLIGDDEVCVCFFVEILKARGRGFRGVSLICDGRASWGGRPEGKWMRYPLTFFFHRRLRGRRPLAAFAVILAVDRPLNLRHRPAFVIHGHRVTRDV